MRFSFVLAILASIIAITIATQDVDHTEDVINAEEIDAFVNEATETTDAEFRKGLLRRIARMAAERAASKVLKKLTRGKAKETEPEPVVAAPEAAAMNAAPATAAAAEEDKAAA